MFKASAQLEFDVQDASLRQTRKRVEAELADIQVGGGDNVSATLSRDVQAATGGGGTAGNSIATAQLDLLESIDDTLDKMAVSGGGGGGGPASTALDLALLKRVGSSGGAAAGGSILGKLGGLASGVGIGSISALGAGTAAAGVGIPAAALYGILREDSANYDAGAQLEQNRERGRGVITPDQGGTEQLNRQLNRIQVDVPPALQDPALQVPAFLEDPTLDVPGFLQDLTLDVPSALRDPPQIGFDVPPALQNLLGGGNTPAVTERIGPGQTRGSGALDVPLDGLDFNVDINLQEIQRDIQRAIEDEFRAASIQRDIQELIQDQLRREFVP